MKGRKRMGKEGKEREGEGKEWKRKEAQRITDHNCCQ